MDLYNKQTQVHATWELYLHEGAYSLGKIQSLI